MVDIRLLGPTQFRGVDPAHLGGRRQQSALVALALAPSQWIPRDLLVSMMWAEPPGSAVSTLQGYLSHLRRALAGSDARLESGSHGYRLVLPPDAVDVHRFETEWKRAGEWQRTRDDGAAEECLQQALALWRGPALLGFEEAPFADATATRLEELRLSAGADLARLCLRTGRSEVALPHLEMFVRIHPTHEGLWALLMQTLCAAGRQADALQAYRRARRYLQEELGVSPGEDLKSLELEILRTGKPTLAQPATSGAPTAGNGGRSFIGRADELASVQALIGHHQVVTLVGAAGAGKTRLASEAARRWTGTDQLEPSPVVDLSEARDLLSAFRAVCSALGIAASELDLERLREAPGRILVLDGCEHLLQATGETVTQLVQRADIRVVVTSRQPLGLPDEVVFRVEPMRLPPSRATLAEMRSTDAVALFLDRSRTNGVSDAELPAVADLCRQLDGLPLAIELAASLARSLPVTDLSGHFGRRPRLLVADEAPGVPRHRSLSAALDWSYQLLNGPERSLFCALGVFAGRFDVDAVAAVCCGRADGRQDGDTDVALITHLVRRSLVAVVPGPAVRRYRLLDSVRAYAVERLTAADAAAFRLRHADHHAGLIRSLASRLDRAGARAAIEEFVEAEPDVAAALEHLRAIGATEVATETGLALVRCLVRLYRMPEARREIATLLGADVGATLRCRVLRWAALLAYFDDDFAECRRLLDIGLALTSDPPLSRERALLRCQESELVRYHGDHERSLALLDDAAALAPEDDAVKIAALRMRTILAWDANCFREARRCAEDWLVLALRSGNLRAEAEARTQLAGVLRELEQYAESAAEYERAMQLFTVLQDPLELAHQQYTAARLALFRGDPRTAHELASQSESAFTRLRDVWGIAVARKAGGEAALALGDVPRALSQLRLAHDGLAVRGFKDDIAAVCLQLARAEDAAGNRSEARWRCEEGLEAALSLQTCRFRQPLEELLGDLSD